MAQVRLSVIGTVFSECVHAVSGFSCKKFMEMKSFLVMDFGYSFRLRELVSL